ncbi:Uncharacterized protein Fot_25858 [Forsythia ovata]|uniref:Uncharacterized protein n=1 Tax=Forsythia ovata TaxID=205694 RepID=A0ABD1UAC1_9LAMI
MSKEFQLISDVSPESSGWTVKVVVAEKFSPRIAQKSPTKYQNLLLMDTELCIPTDEKDFTEIRNIQGVKTVEPRQPTVVTETTRQPYLVAEVPRQPVADLARQPPFVAGEPRQPPFRPRPPRVAEKLSNQLGLGYHATTKPPPGTVARNGGGGTLHKGVVCKVAAKVAVHEDEMISCMSENPRFGNLQSEEKEYFSGSIVEERIQVEPGF